MNIYSGEKGLGGALTNPTELARRKGSIVERYPVFYGKKHYPDVETAYHALKTGNKAVDDQMLMDLIAAKFLQHTCLMEEVTQRGGVAWLETCTHHVSQRPEDISEWEGAGRQSRFIRCLIGGYERALRGERVDANNQIPLF